MMRRYPGVVHGVHDDRSLHIHYDDGDVEDRVYPCYVFEDTGESQSKLDKNFDKIKIELQKAARAVDASFLVLKEKERAWARDLRSRWVAEKSPEVIAAEEALHQAFSVFEQIGSRVHLFAAPPDGGGIIDQGPSGSGMEGIEGPPGRGIIEGLKIEGLD